MKNNKILILGAGWYGCHIGLILKEKGYKIEIFEKGNDIFQGSSGRNQFRLHQGYHYPRSTITIQEAKKNFTKFIKKYKKFIKLPKHNIYCIAKNESLLDFGSYLNILDGNNLNFKQKKYKFLRNIEGSINIKEGIILNSKIKKHYKNKLKKNIKFNKKITDLNALSKNYKIIIDCTNNLFKNNFKNFIRYILTISFVYKKRKNSKVYPLTIMDGKLPSIYPYSDNKNLFTLTHSKYTHIKKFKTFKNLKIYERKISKNLIKHHRLMSEKSIKNFYKNFDKDLNYKGHFLSYKIIPFGKADLRPTFFYKKNNIISLFSPKIANIFSAESIVMEFIKKNA